MGVVYRAEHPRLGLAVAVKVMDPELAADEAFRERFVREARASARIGHPSILPILDAGEHGGELYMATRYVGGDDLRSILRARGRLSPAETLAIGGQIAGALDAAHRNGLVHRDVKPSNVLVEALDGDGWPIVFVADFGLAKRLDDRDAVTASGELLGTIDYVAPEQVSGARIDGRADQYALACVLFECLTGEAPFVRDNEAAVLWAHLHDEPPRASERAAGVPAAVDAVLARGMAKDREERYGSARELVSALAAAFDAEESAPTHATVLAAVQEPSPGRRSRSRLVAVTVLLAALTGAGIAAAVALIGTRGNASTPTRAASERTATTPARAAGDRIASTETVAVAAAPLTPFDRALLQYVPDRLRSTCRHREPTVPRLDSTLTCRAEGAVRSLTYSHARSGLYMLDLLTERAADEGIASPNSTTRTGTCADGVLPALNSTQAVGLSGRMEVTYVGSAADWLGNVLCYKKAERFRIEWTTREVGVYAVATGDDLDALYRWWQTDAGPEP